MPSGIITRVIERFLEKADPFITFTGTPLYVEAILTLVAVPLYSVTVAYVPSDDTE